MTFKREGIAMKSEITIGLLVSGIADYYPVSVCRGAMKAARENAVRLVIFRGSISTGT